MDKKLIGNRIDPGFAFEKAAYGFYDPGQAKGEWAKDFVNKFEKKYCNYLQ